jgi:hypothetical protein
MTQKLDLDDLSQRLQNALKPKPGPTKKPAESRPSNTVPDLPRSKAFIFTPDNISDSDLY